MKTTEELLYEFSAKGYYVEVHPLKRNKGIALCIFEAGGDDVMLYDVSGDTFQEAMITASNLLEKYTNK